MAARPGAFIARYAYDFTAIAGGLLFLVAAVLKYLRIRGGESSLGDQSLFVCELLLGTWFLLGLTKITMRFVGIAVFTLLFSTAAYKYSLGAKTCGCFGAVDVPPWATMLVDGLFVAAFYFAKPRATSEPPESVGTSRWRLARVGVLAVMVVTGFLVVGAHRLQRAIAVAPGNQLAPLAALKAEALKEREKGRFVGFRASVVSENADVKESKTVTQRGPNGSVTTLTIFDRQVLEYDYRIDGADIRRDRMSGGKREEIVVRHGGKTLQYIPSHNQAFIRSSVDYEDLAVDPRCFGLRRGADDVVSYLDRLKVDGEAAEEGPDTVILRARDGQKGTVELALAKDRGHRPVRITYREESGDVRWFTRLEYAKDPTGDGWYLRTGTQYLFGARQPKALGEGVETERAWVAKITYTCLDGPRRIPETEQQATFTVTLPAGTVVADTSKQRGVTYRVPERAQEVPFERLDPRPERQDSEVSVATLRSKELGRAALWTVALFTAIFLLQFVSRRIA